MSANVTLKAKSHQSGSDIYSGYKNHPTRFQHVPLVDDRPSLSSHLKMPLPIAVKIY